MDRLFFIEYLNAMRRPKRRNLPALNRGSMADIAFMMLMFFMVTSTSNMDWGIEMRLQPWFEEYEEYPPSEMPIAFMIDINSKNSIMAESKVVEIWEVKPMCKIYIKEKSARSVIQFRTNRHSSYEMYIAVLNEIKAAYNDIWQSESKKLFGKGYNQISIGQKRILRTKYPFILIEKESDFHHIHSIN